MTDHHAHVPSPLRRWWTRLGRAARIIEVITVVGALAVIVGCATALWILATDPNRGEAWTSGLRPTLFYRDLDAELLEDYAGTYVVAHNSGDTVATTLDALGYGADVVEVDVVSVNGQLYAAHDAPSAWVGDRLFRGPPLERIWVATGGAHAIKLDLKESSPVFTELLLQFLADRRGPRRVIVVSGDPAVLRRVAEQEPTVIRLLGVSSVSRFDRLTEEANLADLLDGVSVYHAVLNEERMAWLQDHNLLVFAWTVNSLNRVNALVLLGVDGITTDNLAIMRLLGGRLGEEPQLERPAKATPEAEEAAHLVPHVAT